MTKQRVSATVDSDVLDAGRVAVAEGRAENLSAWVNQALGRQADHDRRLAALDEFLDAYETEHGEITAEEMADAAHRARARSIFVTASAEDDGRPTPGDQVAG